MTAIFFLSGALFPLANLPTPLTVATRIDPLAYGVDGLRAALIAQSQFALATDAAVLVMFAMAFVALGAWSFSKIQI